MNDENWFRHAIIAMIAGCAWYLAAEFMYRFGITRISDEIILGGASPLLRLLLLQLAVYLVAVTVATIVAVRIFVITARDATTSAILPGIALAGTLLLLVSFDSSYAPHPWWFHAARLAMVTLLPLGVAHWMFRRHA